MTVTRQRGEARTHSTETQPVGRLGDEYFNSRSAGPGFRWSPTTWTAIPAPIFRAALPGRWAPV